jgi:hypothetical protein
VHRRRQRLQSGRDAGDQDVVRRRQIDAHRRHRKMLRDERRIALVLRIAVARKQGGEDVAGSGELRETGDDRRINPSAQPDDESARAGVGQNLAHPAGNPVRTSHSAF